MKRIRRIIAVTLLGIVFVGGSLTSSAACGHGNGTHLVWSYKTNDGSAGTHLYGNGLVCTMTNMSDHYNIVCNTCSAYLGEYVSRYVSHSASH